MSSSFTESNREKPSRLIHGSWHYKSHRDKLKSYIQTWNIWFQSWSTYHHSPLPWKEWHQDPPWKTTPSSTSGYGSQPCNAGSLLKSSPLLLQWYEILVSSCSSHCLLQGVFIYRFREMTELTKHYPSRIPCSYFYFLADKPVTKAAWLGIAV